MPCIAWIKKLKVYIFQCNLECRFCKSACSTSDQKTLRTRLALQTLFYPLNGKAYAFQHKVVRLVRWIGLFFKQCSCSSEWSFSMLPHLLTFTVSINTHTELVCLKCMTPHSVLDFWKNPVIWAGCDRNHTCLFTHKKTTNPNSILLTGVNTSLSNTLAYVKHVTWRNYTICTWILFYSLSLLSLPRDSLHSCKSYTSKGTKDNIYEKLQVLFCRGLIY